MIEHLNTLLSDFPGPTNQMRCFLHILNITAKLIIKQFDVPKAKNGEVMDKAAQALANIADGLDIEEQEEYDKQEHTNDEEEEDPLLDAWTDFCDELTEEQKDDINSSILPVQSMLTKVRILPYSTRS